MRFDLAGWTREATQGSTAEFFHLFERAEKLGFDGVWFSEFRVPDAAWPYPSPLLLAAALLARTERLRVGTAVLVLPLHHPLILAEEIAQVDFQSRGRLDVGVGRGTDPESLETLNVAIDTTRQRFETSCRIIRAALSGETIVGTGDDPWQFAPRKLMSPVVQRPHPPMYVAGSTTETLGFALEHDLPLLLSLEPPETKQLDRIEQLAQLTKRDTAHVRSRSTLARYVCIGSSRAEVKAQLETLWVAWYERRIYYAGKRGIAPSDVPAIQIDKVLREQFIWGTPEDCFVQIQALKQNTGIAHLRFVFNANGLLSNATALDGMDLFAREVMPNLRPEK